MNREILSTFIKVVAILLIFGNSLISQSRINYANREIYLNGANIAWINFSRDFGPGSVNVNSFNNYFQQFSSSGCNSVRVWIHTTGQYTPQFGSDGTVIGPGAETIANLKKLLDTAWENKIGLMLCLWSFDMQRKTLPTEVLDRTNKLLMDSTITRKYINNALLPMVKELKGHPALLAWEIFNEPEGMSVEFGWSDITTMNIPMLNIQRFINMLAGAIHREDPNALVTNGSWSFKAASDANFVAKTSPEFSLENYSFQEKIQLEQLVKEKYGINLPLEKINENFVAKSSLLSNVNYYSDSRLISAGGDLKGTLDFYTVHYYDWAGTSLSPFHHNYTEWKLDKPCVVAEFYPITTFGVASSELYQKLYDMGFAGAMTWGWDNSTYNSKTKENMLYMYQHYPQDIVLFPKTGKIYLFTCNKLIVEKGEEVTIEWKTSPGSFVTLNGKVVGEQGKEKFVLNSSSSFELEATGELLNKQIINVTILPSGKILSFRAQSLKVGSGESTILYYETTKGSIVTLNGSSVLEDGSIVVKPTTNPSNYTLVATGDMIDSSIVSVAIIPAEQVNRAENRNIKVSSVENSFRNKPEYANDANFFTTWASGSMDSQWLEVDLENQIIINKVDIYWNTNEHAKSYRLGISNDKINYTLVKSFTNAAGGFESIPVSNINGRYVKIMLDKRYAASGVFAITEIEIYGIPVSTNLVEKSLPTYFLLQQNFPNPFNPETEINYQIAKLSNIKIVLFNSIGKQIAVLVDELKQPGYFTYRFFANKFNLASGVYYYQLITDGFIQTKKMVLLK